MKIQMYRLWLHGLYGLYGTRCPLSPEMPLNLITHSFTHFEHYIRIWNGEYVHLQGEIENVILIIMIKADLLGFVATMHSGLCEQYVEFLGLSASGFYFLFHTTPCALWQQTPLEPGLIP